MKALVMEDGRIELAEVPKPTPGPGEALVRVRLCGVCRTDLELAAGYMGFAGIPGHEFVGEAVAPADSPFLGRRVVADINFGCGAPGCPDCASGDARHCGARRVLGILGASGALAEYVAIPETALVAVPDSIPDETAVFAEPLAAGLRIVEQLDLAGKRLAVLGDGKLGLITAIALKDRAKSLTLIGRHPHKLALAGRFGVLGVHVGDLDRPVFDVVVEATGRPDGLAQALGLVRPRGIIVLKTTVAATVPLGAARIVVDEITILGSRCGRVADAIDFLADKRLDLKPLVQATYPLDEAPAAFALAGEAGALKVLVSP